MGTGASKGGGGGGRARRGNGGDRDGDEAQAPKATVRMREGEETREGSGVTVPRKQEEGREEGGESVRASIQHGSATASDRGSRPASAASTPRTRHRKEKRGKPNSKQQEAAAGALRGDERPAALTMEDEPTVVRCRDGHFVDERLPVLSRSLRLDIRWSNCDNCVIREIATVRPKKHVVVAGGLEVGLESVRDSVGQHGVVSRHESAIPAEEDTDEGGIVVQLYTRGICQLGLFKHGHDQPQSVLELDVPPPPQHTVHVTDTGMNPGFLKVHRGDSVRWEWQHQREGHALRGHSDPPPSQATHTGHRSLTFTEPLGYTFTTTGVNMCHVVVRPTPVTHSVAVDKRGSLDPPRLAAFAGDRIAFEWVSHESGAAVHHNVVQVEPTEVGWQPVQQGFATAYAAEAHARYAVYACHHPGIVYLGVRDSRADKVVGVISVIVLPLPQHVDLSFDAATDALDTQQLRLTTNDTLVLERTDMEMHDTSHAFSVCHISPKGLGPLALPSKKSERKGDEQISTLTYQFAQPGVYTVSPHGSKAEVTVVVTKAPRLHRVNVWRQGFDPEIVTVARGDVVVWTWACEEPQGIYEVDFNNIPVERGVSMGTCSLVTGSALLAFSTPGARYFRSTGHERQSVNCTVVIEEPALLRPLTLEWLQEEREEEPCLQANVFDQVCILVDSVTATVPSQPNTSATTASAASSSVRQLQVVYPSPVRGGQGEASAAVRVGSPLLLQPCKPGAFRLRLQETGSGSSQGSVERGACVLAESNCIDSVAVRVSPEAGFCPADVTVRTGGNVLFFWYGTDIPQRIVQFFDEDEEEIPPTWFESSETSSGDFIVTFMRPGLFMARSTALASDVLCVIEVADDAPETESVRFFPDTAEYACANMPLHLSCPTLESKIFCTVDGSRPTHDTNVEGNALYRRFGPILLQENDVMVRALASAEGHVDALSRTPVLHMTSDVGMQRRWAHLSVVGHTFESPQQDEHSSTCGLLPPFVLSLKWSSLKDLHWLGARLIIRAQDGGRAPLAQARVLRAFVQDDADPNDANSGQHGKQDTAGNALITRTALSEQPGDGGAENVDTLHNTRVRMRRRSSSSNGAALSASASHTADLSLRLADAQSGAAPSVWRSQEAADTICVRIDEAQVHRLASAHPPDAHLALTVSLLSYSPALPEKRVTSVKLRPRTPASCVRAFSSRIGPRVVCVAAGLVSCRLALSWDSGELQQLFRACASQVEDMHLQRLVLHFRPADAASDDESEAVEAATTVPTAKAVTNSGSRLQRRRSSLAFDALTPHHTVDLAPDATAATVFFDQMGGFARGTAVAASLELVLSGQRIGAGPTRAGAEQEILSLRGKAESIIDVPACKLPAPQQLGKESTHGTRFRLTFPPELSITAAGRGGAAATTRPTASASPSTSPASSSPKATTTQRRHSDDDGGGGDGSDTGRGLPLVNDTAGLLLQVTDGDVYGSVESSSKDGGSGGQVGEAVLPPPPTRRGRSASAAPQREVYARLVRVGDDGRMVEVVRSVPVPLTPSALDTVPVTHTSTGLRIAAPDLHVSVESGSVRINLGHEAPITCLHLLRVEPQPLGAAPSAQSAIVDADLTLTTKGAGNLEAYRPTVTWLQQHHTVPVVPLLTEPVPARQHIEYITDAPVVWLQLVGDRLHLRVCAALVPVNMHVSSLGISLWSARDVEVQGRAVDAPQVVILGVGWHEVDLRLSVPRTTTSIAFYWGETLHSTLQVPANQHIGVRHVLPFDDLHVMGEARSLLVVPLPSLMHPQAAGKEVYVTGQGDVPDTATLESFPAAASLLIHRPVVELTVAVETLKIVYADRRRSVPFELEAPTVVEEEEGEEELREKERRAQLRGDDNQGSDADDDDDDNDGGGGGGATGGESEGARVRRSRPGTAGGGAGSDDENEDGDRVRVIQDALLLRWMATSDITCADHEVDVNDQPRMDVQAHLQRSGGETVVTTKAAQMLVPLQDLTAAHAGKPETETGAADDKDDDGDTTDTKGSTAAPATTFVVSVECRLTGASAVSQAFGWRPSACGVQVDAPSAMSRRWYSVEFHLPRADGIEHWTDASSAQRLGDAEESGPGVPKFSGVVFVWPTHEIRQLDSRLGLPEEYLRQHMNEGDQAEHAVFFEEKATVLVHSLAASHTYSYAFFLKSEGTYFWVHSGTFATLSQQQLFLDVKAAHAHGVELLWADHMAQDEKSGAVTLPTNVSDRYVLDIHDLDADQRVAVPVSGACEFTWRDGVPGHQYQATVKRTQADDDELRSLSVVFEVPHLKLLPLATASVSEDSVTLEWGGFSVTPGGEFSASLVWRAMLPSPWALDTWAASDTLLGSTAEPATPTLRAARDTERGLGCEKREGRIVLNNGIASDTPPKETVVLDGLCAGAVVDAHVQLVPRDSLAAAHEFSEEQDLRSPVLSVTTPRPPTPPRLFVGSVDVTRGVVWLFWRPAVVRDEDVQCVAYKIVLNGDTVVMQCDAAVAEAELNLEDLPTATASNDGKDTSEDRHTVAAVAVLEENERHVDCASNSVHIPRSAAVTPKKRTDNSHLGAWGITVAAQENESFAGFEHAQCLAPVTPGAEGPSAWLLPAGQAVQTADISSDEGRGMIVVDATCTQPDAAPATPTELLLHVVCECEDWRWSCADAGASAAAASATTDTAVARSRTYTVPLSTDSKQKGGASFKHAAFCIVIDGLFTGRVYSVSIARSDSTQPLSWPASAWVAGPTPEIEARVDDVARTPDGTTAVDVAWRCAAQMPDGDTKDMAVAINGSHVESLWPSTRGFRVTIEDAQMPAYISVSANTTVSNIVHAHASSTTVPWKQRLRWMIEASQEGLCAPIGPLLSSLGDDRGTVDTVVCTVFDQHLQLVARESIAMQDATAVEVKAVKASYMPVLVLLDAFSASTGRVFHFPQTVVTRAAAHPRPKQGAKDEEVTPHKHAREEQEPLHAKATTEGAAPNDEGKEGEEHVQTAPHQQQEVRVHVEEAAPPADQRPLEEPTTPSAPQRPTSARRDKHQQHQRRLSPQRRRQRPSRPTSAQRTPKSPPTPHRALSPRAPATTRVPVEQPSLWFTYPAIRRRRELEEQAFAALRRRAAVLTKVVRKHVGKGHGHESVEAVLNAPISFPPDLAEELGRCRKDLLAALLALEDVTSSFELGLHWHLYGALRKNTRFQGYDVYVDGSFVGQTQRDATSTRVTLHNNERRWLLLDDGSNDRGSEAGTAEEAGAFDGVNHRVELRVRLRNALDHSTPSKTTGSEGGSEGHANDGDGDGELVVRHTLQVSGRPFIPFVAQSSCRRLLLAPAASSKEGRQEGRQRAEKAVRAESEAKGVETTSQEEGKRPDAGKEGSQQQQQPGLAQEDSLLEDARALLMQRITRKMWHRLPEHKRIVDEMFERGLLLPKGVTLFAMTRCAGTPPAVEGFLGLLDKLPGLDGTVVMCGQSVDEATEMWWRLQRTATGASEDGKDGRGEDAAPEAASRVSTPDVACHFLTASDPFTLSMLDILGGKAPVFVLAKKGGFAWIGHPMGPVRRDRPWPKLLERCEDLIATHRVDKRLKKNPLNQKLV